jgi:hypothetical protein
MKTKRVCEREGEGDREGVSERERGGGGVYRGKKSKRGEWGREREGYTMIKRGRVRCKR